MSATRGIISTACKAGAVRKVSTSAERCWGRDLQWLLKVQSTNLWELFPWSFQAIRNRMVYSEKMAMWVPRNFLVRDDDWRGSDTSVSGRRASFDSRSPSLISECNFENILRDIWKHITILETLENFDCWHLSLKVLTKITTDERLRCEECRSRGWKNKEEFEDKEKNCGGEAVAH